MDIGTTTRNNTYVNETIKDENVKEIDDLYQHVNNNLGIQQEYDCRELPCAEKRHNVDYNR